MGMPGGGWDVDVYPPFVDWGGDARQHPCMCKPTRPELVGIFSGTRGKQRNLTRPATFYLQFGIVFCFLSSFQTCRPILWLPGLGILPYLPCSKKKCSELAP